MGAEPASSYGGGGVQEAEEERDKNSFRMSRGEARSDLQDSATVFTRTHDDNNDRNIASQLFINHRESPKSHCDRENIHRIFHFRTGGVELPSDTRPQKRQKKEQN